LYLKRKLRSILQDAAGFAGTEMIRRVIGLGYIADLASIKDVELRLEADKKALMIGSALIKKRGEMENIEDLVATAVGSD